MPSAQPDDAVQARRLACWERFQAAAGDAKHGDYRKAEDLVADVRRAAGEAVAAQAKRELWKYVLARRARPAKR